MERTGTGDPLRSLALLWRTEVKTGRSGLTLDRIIAAAIAVANEIGVDAMSMRKIAEQLGVGVMTLYSHVPGKAELVDLMVDFANGSAYADGTTPAPGSDWRAAIEQIAEHNWRLLEAHRWMLGVDSQRPPLGPGTIAKYDIELRPLVGIGLDDVEVDQVLTLVLGQVTHAARQMLGQIETAAGSGRDDSEWWASSGPALDRLIDSTRFPYAARIGEAAGQEFKAASDPRRAYEFGLRTILDGIETLIARRRGPDESTNGAGGGRDRQVAVDQEQRQA